MQNFTNSKECTKVEFSETYISWNESKWETFGNVRSYNESVKNMCKPIDGVTNIFLTGTFMNYSSILNLNYMCLDVYQSMRECMQTCEKLDKSRGPKLENVDEFNTFLKKIAETVYFPGTSKLFPNALAAYWISITDESVEGTWVDWFTGDSVDLTNASSGQLGM